MNPAQLHRKPRILVAPLDWGLGHATRCVPVIRELLAQGADLVLGGSGASGLLLQQEFPGLAYFEIPSHTVRYSRSAGGFTWKMLWQYPRLHRQVKNEQQWLQDFLTRDRVDAVLSDNRFGLFHPQIPSVLITHQLGIQTAGPAWLQRWVRQKNYSLINRFAACWIPDLPGTDNLAGELSHPGLLPRVPVHYTGLLSRISKTGTKEQPGHLLAVLSGPEPQRSILENKILEELAHYNGTATVVRGLPASRTMIPSTNQLHFYNHLPANQLAEEMMKADYVIARSGYSTLMDLALLQKKAVLIPTPGQPEQEYLSRYLQQSRRAYSVSQKDFTLNASLLAADKFTYQSWPATDENLLSGQIHTFLQSLSLH